MTITIHRRHLLQAATALAGVLPLASAGPPWRRPSRT
jgi:hypothetical protein